MAVMAVDIGGTNIRLALFHTPTSHEAIKTVPCRDLGIPVPVPAFGDLIAQEIATWRSQGTSVEGLGLGVAAVVDHRTGHVRVGENVGWRDVPLQQLLATRCQIPVRVDVDASCGALAEARLGSGADHDHFLYVVIGTGIGHSLVLNRQVWHGMHAAANVFGHLKVEPQGAPCYCGGAGCLCQYASGQGLARLGHIAHPGKISPLGAEVVSAFENGAPWARSAVGEAMRRLALALSGAYNLLDIECAVLGGGVVSPRFPDLEDLRRQVEPLVYPEIRPIVLRRGALGDQAVLHGAALLAFDSLKGDPQA
ncbi:MAG: ROK family protein [Caldilineaceae bacterium]|nr:ROK family protein [Caldilineaceae bacterium]